MNLSISIYLYIGILTIIFLNNLKHKIIYMQNLFIVFLMGFFTTFFHELAHYLIALILGGRPKELSIIPKKMEYEGYIYYTFGNVNAYANKFTGFFIGIAPVIWLIAGYFLAKWYFYFFEADFLHTELFFILEWILVENGLPSKSDLKIAFQSIWGAVFFILIAGAYLLRSGYGR